MPFDFPQAFESGEQASAALYQHALRYDGLTEIPGPKHNPKIVEWAQLDDATDWIDDDETPWCATAANGWCAEIGLPTTGSAMARSFLNWGRAVDTRHAVTGDFVVLWRKSPSSTSGHITNFVRWDGPNHFIGYGGNQSNQVRHSRYPVSRILKRGVRRYDPSPASSGGRPTLRSGDRGAFVIDLQDQLHELRYFLGKIDGIFGPMTKSAVMDFQARSGLATDGIVGAKTWQALREDAKPKPERAITTADLRTEGSRTIKGADGATLAAGLGLGGLTLDKVTEAASKAEGLVDTLSRLATDHGIELLIGVAIFGLAIYAVGMVKNARVDDSITGANAKR
jgi:uncharacterized protein (TIGR02594 family)